MGVFAKEDIEAEELLMRIPREAFIHVLDMEERKEVDDTWSAFYHNMCLLTKKLKEEMETGEDSPRAPYVRFLKSQQRGQIPALWSAPSKNLLRPLLPYEDPPTEAELANHTPRSNSVDWIDDHLKSTCISPTDPSDEQIVALVKQRGYDDALIPLWDMFNHANGRYTNTRQTSVRDAEGVRVYASKEIRAGDEVFASYDRCADCEFVNLVWGTPEIFRDFGFVEPYPHRYHLEERIWFEIVEVDEKDGDKGNDGDGSGFRVLWDDGITWPDVDNYGNPDREGIEFLEREVTKFESALARMSEVPEEERGMVSQYISTVIFDYKLAIAAAERDLELEEEDEDSSDDDEEEDEVEEDEDEDEDEEGDYVDDDDEYHEEEEEDDDEENENESGRDEL